MKRIIKTFLTSLCAVFLSCCYCDEELCGPAVTYEVDGSAQGVTVRYHDEHGSEEFHSSIALPWVKRFTIKYRGEEYHGGGAPPGTYLAFVSAEMAHGSSGHVIVSIYVNDTFMCSDTTRGSEKLTATARHAVNW